MRNVEPEVYLLARSAILPENMAEWLENLGVSQDGIRTLVKAEKTGGEKIVESAGRRCYMSFEVGLNPNVTRIRDDIAKYIEHILNVGHGSVCEHSYYTFAIENVSRVFTGEMNRHRAGMAISEGSMRYIRYTDIPFWMPACLRTTLGAADPRKNKKEHSQQVFFKAFRQMEENYTELCEIWKDELDGPDFAEKKHITSMMRRIIGMGVATGGIWTGNLRALRHICTMRCDEAAEEEICLVAGKILGVLMTVEPNFFKDFTKNEKGYWAPKFRKV